MASFVAPGVYTQEYDFTAYTTNLATTICGMVVTASKGPLNTRTLITNINQLIGTFGNPSSTHVGLYAAQAYLRRGNMLWVVRVADYSQYSDDITVKDSGDSQDAVTFSIPEDVGPGTWSDGMQIKISAGFESGTYNIAVLNSSNLTLETYERIKVGSGNTSDANYITTRINGVSNYIYVTVENELTTLKTGTYTFSGGDDGTPVDSGTYIGTTGTPPVTDSTGMQLFANPEEVDINMLCVPGAYDASVVTAGLALCEARADAIYIADMPSGLTVTQAVDWHNGVSTLPDAPAAAWNTSYGCTYYNWLTILDSLTSTLVQIPNSGHIAGAFAYNDYSRGVQFAPAGEQRGMLTDVSSIEYSPTVGERGYMDENGNSVNPIVNMTGKGIMIFGQKTLQRSATATRDINVRRLLLYMRKVIATSTQYLVFEPNDEVTWTAWTNLLTPFMESLVGNRSIIEYELKCDSTTNTTQTISNNELHGWVSIIPTRSAEKIITAIGLYPYGATFTELA